MCVVCVGNADGRPADGADDVGIYSGQKPGDEPEAVLNDGTGKSTGILYTADILYFPSDCIGKRGSACDQGGQEEGHKLKKQKGWAV